MKLNRKVAAAGIVLATVTAMTGCSDTKTSTATGAGDGDTKAITIGWVPANTTGVFNTATQYFQKSADEANTAGLNVKLVTQAPKGAEADTAGFLQIIENMISQKVSVIVVSPGDAESIKPAVKEANDAGIPVVYVNLLDDQTGVDVSAFVGFDNEVAAEISGYAVLDYFGGPGVLGAGDKVEVTDDQSLDIDFWRDLYKDADLSGITAKGALIEGVKGTTYSTQRLAGFNKVMALAPGMKIEGTLAGDWDRQKGGDAAADLTTRFNDLDFIWAASNEMALGTVNILGGAGKLDVNPNGGAATPGKISVFTNDNTAESTDAIRQGKIIAETTHGFADWGWVGTQVAVKLACGEAVNEKNDIHPRTVYATNADQFYPNPQLPEIDWASIKADCK